MVAFAGSILCVGSGPGLGQINGRPGAEPVGIEEITVTAQKRAENLQSVPIAITAFTNEALQQRGITDVSQLGKFAPGVEIVGTSPFSGSTQVLSAFIRGIGQNDFAFNLDPGVGVYVDGVYFARTVGAVVDLLDVDRVEILKGPQGTLFGRNTIGGAISVVTRDPGDTFAGRGEITYGRFQRVDVRGAVDIPLVADRLTAQISVSSKQRDGYFKFLAYPGNYQTDVGRFVRPDNTTYGSAGGEDTQNLRGKLKWQVSDDVTLRVTGDYMNSNDEPTPSQLLAVQPGLKDIYNACISTPVATLAAGPLGQICNTPRGLPAGAAASPVVSPLGGVNTDADPYNNHLIFDNRFIPTVQDTAYSTGAGYSKVKTGGVSATLDARLLDELSIKSISAYRSLHSRFAMDVDGTPIPMGDHAFSMDQWQISQEVQLIGSFFEDRLKAVGGVYYFHEQGGLTDYVQFADGLLQIYGPNRFKTDSYATFSQLDFKLTDDIGLTGGARYTRDEKFFRGGQRDLNSLAYKLGYPLSLHPDPNDPTLYFPQTDNTRSFNNLSFKAGINYRLAERVLTYATYSEGYKSGGWTTRATTPILEAPTFNPEKAATYEIGLKSELLDRKLQANLAAYYTNYRDLQVTVQQGVSPITLNAAQSEIEGVEAEVKAAPTNALTIGATFGYIHAKYTKKDAGTNLGNAFLNTPKFQASLDVDYEILLQEGAYVLLHADDSYKTRIARDGMNTPLLFAPAAHVVGALVSFHNDTDAWHADAGVTNLTDRRFLISGQNQEGIGYIAGTYNRPREWYLRLGYRF